MLLLTREQFHLNFIQVYVPPFPYFRIRSTEISVDEYDYVEVPTKGDKPFRKITVVTQDYKVSQLIDKMNTSLSTDLQHHLCNLWQKTHGDPFGSLHLVGVGRFHIEYRERHEMTARSWIAW